MSDICAKITTPFKSSTASPASNMHLEVANLVPKSSDEPLKGMNVVGHQSSKPLELQVEEENGNQAKVIIDEVNEGERALIDDLKAPQEDLIVTREEDEVKIEDLDVTKAVRSEELMHPAAVPDLIMPLKVMILQPEVSDVVPTKSPSEFAPVIINEVANSE